MTSIDPATTAFASTAPTPSAPATAAVPNTLSTVSVALGIAGILLGQGVLAVAAIVLGFIARSREPQAITTANWGLVLGFVGVFGGFLVGILAFFGFAPLFALGTLPFWDLWDFWG